MSTFNRARLLLNNLTLSAVSVACATDSTDYPAANLLDPDRTAKTRCAASGEIDIELTGDQWAQALAITGHTLSVSGQVRVVAAPTQGELTSAPTFDSGWVDAYNPLIAFGAGSFGDETFGGYIDPSTPFYRPVTVIWFGQVVQENWYRISFSDPDGGAYVYLGVAAISTAIEMTRNFSENWSIKTIDTAATRRSTSGQLKTARAGTRYTVVKMTFHNVGEEIRWTIFRLLRQVGQSTPVVIALHPDNGQAAEPHTTLYGSITKPPQLKFPNSPRAQFALEMAEQAGD